MSDNLLPNAFQSAGVNIDAVQSRRAASVRPDFLFQPLGEIVGHAVQTQAGLDEVMMDGVQADLPQAIGKSGRVWADELRGQHHDVGGTEIEWFMRQLRSAGLGVVRKNSSRISTIRPRSAFDRGEFANVHTGQLFRQARLVAGRKSPVREVVGKSLPDEVVFLQRAERVLKDGILGTSLAAPAATPKDCAAFSCRCAAGAPKC